MQVKTIAEQLLFSTVRIETTTQQGKGAGTGFIFSYVVNGNNYIFLVTNKHVVDGAISGRFFFTLSDGKSPQIGKRFDINIEKFNKMWFGHPDPQIDVMIMPLAPILQGIQNAGKQVFFISITHDLIPTNEQINSLDAIEEVIFIGYPNGLFDSINLMPLVRRGTTATHIKIDYEGKPIFIVDASVFPGSSGSPVLIANTGSYSHKGGLVIGSRVIFLGMISSVMIREEQGRISYITSPVSHMPVLKTRQMIDLGIVIKSSIILDTVKLFVETFEKNGQPG